MTTTATGQRMFIDGSWVDAADGATFDSVDPATEKVIGTVPAAGWADVNNAVAAARAATPTWAAMAWEDRAEAIRQLAERIRDEAEDLARLDSWDAGLPLAGSRGDVTSTIQELLYFAGLGGEVKGTTLPPTPTQLASTHREPYGVVGRIVPFNHPFKFAAGKSAAPLVTGNTIVIKPSEHTSLSALRLAALTEGLFPPGVFNVVTGSGSTGAAIVEHPDVPRIAFTGSVPVGRAVLRGAAEHVKYVSLELGGKNPMIVFDDANPERAASAAVSGMNLRRSMGQSCQSNSRVLVHRRIKEAFLTKLTEIVDVLGVGDPLEEGHDLGPLAFREHYERVMAYIDAGRNEGARLAAGGQRPAELATGYYVRPTIFADASPDMRIAQEEIFGPVMTVFDWDDEDTAVELANAVEYGLTANVWTNDINRAYRVARRLQAGTVSINGQGRKPLGTPFGGYKHSGLGLEGSLDELLSYTQLKSVVLTVDGLTPGS